MVKCFAAADNPVLYRRCGETGVDRRNGRRGVGFSDSGDADGPRGGGNPDKVGIISRRADTDAYPPAVVQPRAV